MIEKVEEINEKRGKILARKNEKSRIMTKGVEKMKPEDKKAKN